MIGVEKKEAKINYTGDHLVCITRSKTSACTYQWNVLPNHFSKPLYLIGSNRKCVLIDKMYSVNIYLAMSTVLKTPKYQIINCRAYVTDVVIMQPFWMIYVLQTKLCLPSHKFDKKALGRNLHMAQTRRDAAMPFDSIAHLRSGAGSAFREWIRLYREVVFLTPFHFVREAFDTMWQCGFQHYLTKKYKNGTSIAKGSPNFYSLSISRVWGRWWW